MAVRIVMPKLGMVMEEGTVAKWERSPGDEIKQGDVIAEIETEKINYNLEATDSGILHQVVKEGAVVPVSGLLGYLLAEGEAPPETASEPPPAATAPAAGSRRAPPSPRPAGADVPSTPGARRLAANLGVDLSKVTPTGPRGRITDADVRAHAEQPEASPTPSLPPGLPQPSRTVPVTGMRKAIADHMRSSISSTAQLSFFLEVDVTEVTRLRREGSKDSDVTLTTAHVLMKACAETLRRHPEHNTILSGDSILYFDEINIGIAVALSDGLIVPVVARVDQKDVSQIAGEVQELTSKAAKGTLQPDDLAGGTFTISVLGSVDGFTPILNQGQNAILGAGRSVEKPVIRNGEIVIREMMTLSLTVDHQAIDGAVVASFLRRLQRTIERPAALFK